MPEFIRVFVDHITKAPHGDGLVHIERPRHHLTLCDEVTETRTWDLANGRPVSCLECLGLEHRYYEL